MKNHSFSFGFSEARLIAFAGTEKDHQEQIEKGFEAASQPKNPLTLAEFKKTTEIIARQGTQDVQVAAPKWTQRIGRWVLSKAGGAVNLDVYDAEHKTLSDQVDLNVRQRLNAAQENISFNKTKAISKIVNRACDSKNSHAFLSEKAEVCAQMIEALKKKKEELDKHGERAGSMRKIEKLELKIGQLETIGEDVKAKIESTDQLDIAQNIEEADAYFREIFSLYRPESLFRLTGLLQAYALTGDNPAKAQPFISELRKISEKMFPNRADAGRREEQLQRMLQVARTLLGEGKWRRILRNSLFVSSGVASATMVGVLPVAGIGVLGAAAVGIRNWYKHGRPGMSRKQWYQEQVASFYTSAPAKALKEVAEMLEIPKVSDRLKKLEGLPGGTRFQIVFKNKNLDLTLTSKRGTLLFATDAQGHRYSFDTDGFNGKHFCSYEKAKSGKSGGTKIEHLELKAPSDQLFSA